MVPGRPFPGTGTAAGLSGRGRVLTGREVDGSDHHRGTCRWRASLTVSAALVVPQVPVKAAIRVIHPRPPLAEAGTGTLLVELLLVVRATQHVTSGEFQVLRTEHRTAAALRTCTAIGVKDLAARLIIGEFVEAPAVTRAGRCRYCGRNAVHRNRLTVANGRLSNVAWDRGAPATGSTAIGDHDAVPVIAASKAGACRGCGCLL